MRRGPWAQIRSDGGDWAEWPAETRFTRTNLRNVTDRTSRQRSAAPEPHADHVEGLVRHRPVIARAVPWLHRHRQTPRGGVHDQVEHEVLEQRVDVLVGGRLEPEVRHLAVLYVASRADDLELHPARGGHPPLADLPRVTEWFAGLAGFWGGDSIVKAASVREPRDRPPSSAEIRCRWVIGQLRMCSLDRAGGLKGSSRESKSSASREPDGAPAAVIVPAHREASIAERCTGAADSLQRSRAARARTFRSNRTRARATHHQADP